MMEEKLFKDHSRIFESNKYVYPVISRRSGGISLGINLSMRKECNFDCPYCQVDRREIEPVGRVIQLDVLEKELIELIELILSGEFYKLEKFSNINEEYRSLKDIAISGDGESTTSKYFKDVSGIVFKTIKNYLNKIKILPVVITNGSMLHKTEISDILYKMIEMGGGPWIKLDASNEEEFKIVAETKILYSKILNNIIQFSKRFPITLQTILYKLENGKFSFEIDGMIDTLKSIQKNGGKIGLIQLYTIARDTRVKGLSSVSEEELNSKAEKIKKTTGISVRIYP